MIADDTPAAQGRETDAAGLARTRFIIAVVARNVDQAIAATLRHRLAELQRRARRRVDLVPMMRLGDLDVVVVTQRVAREARELR